ncbi:UDP-4-amino-4,6-dideoxy-N-acetyl-beta-L-altrosamine N-acetyltransferase [Helicobacter sp. 11S02629-2]|nr:UDP-4-amino-4,6-dideoxy-N-acetyl-beta-L-altrosamine N-acetyltransferase [Helicobacter sp. 11S02629-2]
MLNLALKASKPKTFRLLDLEAKPFSDLDKEEIAKTLEYRNHDLVRHYMYEDAPISMQTHLDFIHSQKDNLNSRYFLVRDIKTLNHIGVISLTRINLKHKHAYLGIYKNPYLQERVGTRLLDMLCFIASALGLHMLYLEVIEDNAKALSLYENYGFKCTGKLEDAICQKGSFKNVLVYGIEVGV